MTSIIEYIPNYINLIIYGVIFAFLNHLMLSLLLILIANRRKLKNIWLCWIPIGNLWMVGKIINEFSIGKKKFDGAEYRLITSSIVSLLVIRIPVIGILIGIAYVILVSSCFIELFKTSRALLEIN